MRELSDLEKAIGHEFARHELLLRALTHSSHSHEQALPESSSDHAVTEPDLDAVSHNEQMEFLGDAILGFLVSRDLVERFPAYSEGQLSKIKAHLVSSSHLFSVAQQLNLGAYLKLGRGEERSGGRGKRALLVDAMEALIAALYLDAGLEKTGEVVHRVILEGWLEAGIETFPFGDFKSSLQEHLQAIRKPQPRYQVVEARGPEHRKTFTVEVRVGRTFSARAEGPTKKAAEQEAARAALQHFKPVQE